MSKHRVFIYGSCVSRDTFEHFDPEQFELVQYVARQSALSAYTRPVTLIEPPHLDSPFQQRMVSGDYASNLQTLIPEAAAQTDLVLIDLTDERLGAYVLPDGSVVTRSTELIDSGAEAGLPAGTQHLPFGSDQHFQYWSHGVAAVGEMIRQHMPRAAVVVLDIPWAEHSEDGSRTPHSYGVGAAQANPIFNAYRGVAKRALGAEVVSLPENEVRSSPTHPWGDAPFHYASSVYHTIVKAIAAGGMDANEGVQPAQQPAFKTANPKQPTQRRDRVMKAAPAHDNPTNLIIAGTQQAGAEWMSRQLDAHAEISFANGKGRGFFNRPARFEDEASIIEYRQAIEAAGPARWLGDCTSDYFWHSHGGPFSPRKPDTATQIDRMVSPSSRIVLILREPVTRAIEAFWHNFSIGRIGLNAGIFRTSSKFGLVDLGFYSRHYTHWASVLGEDRVHVLLYDDLLADPQAQIAAVLNHLDVEAEETYWSSVVEAPIIKPKPWLKPIRAREPITDQEIAALFSLYESEVSFVESLMKRELHNWRNLDRIVQEANEL